MYTGRHRKKEGSRRREEQGSMRAGQAHLPSLLSTALSLILEFLFQFICSMVEVLAQLFSSGRATGEIHL